MDDRDLADALAPYFGLAPEDVDALTVTVHTYDGEGGSVVHASTVVYLAGLYGDDVREDVVEEAIGALEATAAQAVD